MNVLHLSLCYQTIHFLASSGQHLTQTSHRSVRFAGLNVGDLYRFLSQCFCFRWLNLFLSAGWGRADSPLGFWVWLVGNSFTYIWAYMCWYISLGIIIGHLFYYVGLAIVVHLVKALCITKANKTKNIIFYFGMQDSCEIKGTILKCMWIQFKEIIFLVSNQT